MVGSGFIDKDLAAYRELLQLSGMRGIDSTGIYFARTTEDKIQYIEQKSIENSLNFVDIYGWSSKSILARTDMNVYMGHTRSKTAGRATLKNCHPFNLSRYVGAHNGTLYDWEYYYSGKDETDSELMFKEMDRRGNTGPKEVLNELCYESAFAVTIFDKAHRKLIFARNKHRPLWVGIGKDRPILYWASEERFLKFVSESHQIKMDIYYFEAFKMYTVDPNNIKLGDRSPWEITDLKVKTKDQKESKSRVDYAYQSKVEPLTSSASVITMNATTGESKPVKNPMDNIIVKGITDVFNATDNDTVLSDLIGTALDSDTPESEDIDWNNVANFQ